MPSGDLRRLVEAGRRPPLGKTAIGEKVATPLSEGAKRALVFCSLVRREAFRQPQEDPTSQVAVLGEHRHRLGDSANVLGATFSVFSGFEDFHRSVLVGVDLFVARALPDARVPERDFTDVLTWAPQQLVRVGPRVVVLDRGNEKSDRLELLNDGDCRRWG